jgi:hypothetical protein
MDKLFRLSLGAQRDPAVEAWLNRQSGELGTLVRTWFGRMRACGLDVLEMMHDGCPVVCVRDVPFAYINVFKAHVSVGFFRGAWLKDPAHLLEGTGKRMRHVKLKPGVALDFKALGTLIQEAYADVKARSQDSAAN